MATEKKAYWAFGGMISTIDSAHFLGEVYAKDEGAAYDEAWELLVEEYESYAGLHGIPSWDEVREDVAATYGDEEIDDVQVQEAYDEEVSSWTQLKIIEAIEGVDPESLDAEEV